MASTGTAPYCRGCPYSPVHELILGLLVLYHAKRIVFWIVRRLVVDCCLADLALHLARVGIASDLGQIRVSAVWFAHLLDLEELALGPFPEESALVRIVRRDPSSFLHGSS